MQLGFVIDHSRCIGCHACTVACKSENDVPVGDFRTWVKYTEAGEFPEVKRSFAVLRCNQCSEPPCVDICPVTALDKRPDGIVDVDHDICIGCKACMQGCPYDALYLNEETGTAEKCHFCAHRTEMGLAPACAVVCPTEAIVPGDFDDPGSVVSGMRGEFDLQARKTEAGTGPNVFYREAGPAGLDPALTNAGGGYLWSQQRGTPQVDADIFRLLEERAKEGVPEQANGHGAHGVGAEGRAKVGELSAGMARTVYDVDRKPHWGGAISGYLFFKSLTAGVMGCGLLALPPFAGTGAAAISSWLVPVLSLVFLTLTMGLLIADLKRPERFLSIVLRPNMKSWLAKGSYLLMVHGGLASLWALLGVLGVANDGALGVLLALLTVAFAALAACYTAWLFAQAKGRVLWMRKGLAPHLVAQAVVAGSAFLLVLEGVFGGEGVLPLVDGSLVGGAAGGLHTLLLMGLVAHLAFTVTEDRQAPDGREEEYHRAARLVTHGPYARKHWVLGVLLGGAIPVTLLISPAGLGVWTLASVLALVGLWVEEDVFVRAGQALKIS